MNKIKTALIAAVAFATLSVSAQPLTVPPPGNPAGDYYYKRFSSPGNAGDVIALATNVAPGAESLATNAWFRLPPADKKVYVQSNFGQTAATNASIALYFSLSFDGVRWTTDRPLKVTILANAGGTNKTGETFFTNLWAAQYATLVSFSNETAATIRPTNVVVGYWKDNQN